MKLENRLKEKLNKSEKNLFVNSIKKYRLTPEYSQVKKLNKTWQYNPNTIAENVAQGYGLGKVLIHRKLNALIPIKYK